MPAYPLLVLATQLLDGFGLALASGHGTEGNPLMAAALTSLGLPALVAVKALVGGLIGLLIWRARVRSRNGVAIICLVGCVGALTELLAVV